MSEAQKEKAVEEIELAKGLENYALKLLSKKSRNAVEEVESSWLDGKVYGALSVLVSH